MEINRDELKQELLEELKKEYKLIPIKEAHLSVSDILDKYYDDISIQIGITLDWSLQNSIAQALRKVVCMHFGYNQLKEIPADKRNDYRLELDRFIREYILGKGAESNG